MTQQIDDPHVITAILCVVIALAVCAFVLALINGKPDK